MKLTSVVLTGLVLLGMVLGAGACRPAQTPGTQKAGDPGQLEEPAGVADPDAAGAAPAPDGQGGVDDELPVVLKAGVLVFGLFTANADDSLSQLKLATVEHDGQGFAERLILNRYDEVLTLSPDRTKLLAYRFDRSTPRFTKSLLVYDLVRATVTPLSMPSFVEIHRHFSWSPDSRFITCAVLADAGAPETAADNVYRLVRVPADGSPGAYVDTVGIRTCLPREIAPVPGRDAVVFTGPPDQGIGLNVNLHDFGAGSGRTLFYHANLPQLLAVSKEGGTIAYQSTGPAWVILANLLTGKTTATEDVPEYGPAGCLQDLTWSPGADLLAIVRDDCNYPGYPPPVTVVIYDLARGGITVRTDPIDSVMAGHPLTVWAADGSALFLAAGTPSPPPELGLPVGATTIYRIDPTTGGFTAIYTCRADQCIRSLNLVGRE